MSKNIDIYQKVLEERHNIRCMHGRGELGRIAAVSAVITRRVVKKITNKYKYVYRRDIKKLYKLVHNNVMLYVSSLYANLKEHTTNYNYYLNELFHKSAYLENQFVENNENLLLKLVNLQASQDKINRQFFNRIMNKSGGLNNTMCGWSEIDKIKTTEKYIKKIQHKIADLLPTDIHSSYWSDIPGINEMVEFFYTLFVEMVRGEQNNQNNGIISISAGAATKEHYKRFPVNLIDEASDFPILVESFWRNSVQNMEIHTSAFRYLPTQKRGDALNFYVKMHPEYTSYMLRRRIDSVVLDHPDEVNSTVDLGEFTILVSLFDVLCNYMGNEDTFSQAHKHVIPTNPVYNDSGYFHPHVSPSNGLCLGEGGGAFSELQKHQSLSFIGLLDVLQAIVDNYAPGDAYRGAELWSWYDPDRYSEVCANCDESVESGDCYYTVDDEVICRYCRENYFVDVYVSEDDYDLVHSENDNIIYSERIGEYIYLDDSVGVVYFTQRGTRQVLHNPSWDTGDITYCPMLEEYVLEEDTIEFAGDMVSTYWYKNNVTVCNICGEEYITEEYDECPGCVEEPVENKETADA